MAHPLYVLLPDGVEWTEVPGTTAQRPAPVRWYLRQSMPMATTQTAVLVDGDEESVTTIAAVAAHAEKLGGIVVDAVDQQVIEPSSGTALR